MKNYLIRHSATGKLYVLRARSDDEVYRRFASAILDMPGANDPDFDTGNVDIDLVELPKVTNVLADVPSFDGD